MLGRFEPGVGYIFVLLHQGYIFTIVCKFLLADRDTRAVSLDWMPHYRITKGLSHVLQNKGFFACILLNLLSFHVHFSPSLAIAHPLSSLIWLETHSYLTDNIINLDEPHREEWACYDCKFWLMVSIVIALYSKGSGKNGKHAAVPNVTNVASVSYAGFQIFQCMHRQLFRPITSATVAFSTNQYLLMPSTSILCRLSAIPQARNNDIEIHSEDWRIYNTLDVSSRQLEATMKLFAKWGKGKAAQEVELNEEDEE